jgi:aryl-alcohol dehydrogenase-like predicted oxidoreductase
MALAFVNQQPFVTSNLIGATNMQQLKSNINSINLTLSDDVNEGIKAIRRQYPMSF